MLGALSRKANYLAHHDQIASVCFAGGKTYRLALIGEDSSNHWSPGSFQERRGERRGGEQRIPRKAQELLKEGTQREQGLRRERQSQLTAGRT